MANQLTLTVGAKSDRNVTGWCPYSHQITGGLDLAGTLSSRGPAPCVQPDLQRARRNGDHQLTLTNPADDDVEGIWFLGV